MARIEISLPSKFIFSTDIPIRISDINRGGHLSWDSMFRLLDEASVQFWSSLDSPGSEDERISHITVDAGINYKRQAFHGQTLRVEIAADEFTNKGFDLVFRVTEVVSGSEIARAKAGILCYDYEKQKVISIPEELRSKLSR
ncbi:MAG: thioesterase family protein [Chloroflexi bacterium]|nr:thioesterase family protein [Chloroflexota bacterium]